MSRPPPDLDPSQVAQGERSGPVPAGLSELGFLIELEKLVFGKDAWSPNMIETELRNPDSRYLILFDTRQPLAWAGYRVLLDEAELITLGVRPEHRREGLASRLLAAVETNCARSGVCHIFLEVAEQNDVARACYRAQGYHDVGRRKDYYRPGEDAILMRKALS